MKDMRDSSTSDLLLSKNAQAQRSFKAKKRNEGYVQKLNWVHSDSFDDGFRSARGRKGFFPASSTDPASYAAGYGAGLLKRREEEIEAAPVVEGL